MLPTFLGVAVALLACSALIIVGLLQRPAGGLSIPTGSRVIHVDEFDYGFRIPAGPLPAGNVVFVDTNRGSIPHELVMFKTNKGATKLPLRKDGSVDEENAAIEDVLDSGSALVPGETRILSATLDPGSYVIVCNLPTHSASG